MKKILSVLCAVMLSACSVEMQDPKKQTEEEPDKKEPQPEATPHVPQPNKGICSFEKDPDKGCLKATISSGDLQVGDYQYDIGVKAFARQFTSDLADSDLVELRRGETLEFSRQVTVNNFYSNFGIFVEGSHTTYSAYHTGLGNLQVNGMAVGYYDILVAKDFDLKVLDEEGRTVDYKCVVLWSRHSVDILPGEETPLSEAISQFDLEVYNKSCSGTKSKKKSSQAESKSESNPDQDVKSDQKEEDNSDEEDDAVVSDLENVLQQNKSK